MTEEEKKAIELIGCLNLNCSYIITSKQWNEQDVHKAIDTILNLIGKLKKKNEELMKNQKYKKDFNGEKIFCLEYDKETLRDIVLEQQEEIKELNNRDTSRLSEIGELRTKNSHLENEIKYYYIPKDKISELIKKPTIITSDGDYISVKKVKKLLEEE